MKKIIAMLIACLMVVALVPVVAAPAAAADKVVFVGKDGTGDGSAADKPMGDLVAAFAAIGDDNGTIVLVNMYESNATHTVAAHAGHITVTSKYNGVDYNGGISAATTNHLILGGDTTFENMNIEVKTTWVIRACFNHVTFDEGVNVTVLGTAASHGLYLVAADQDKASACDPSQSTHLTLKSGKFLEVVGGARSAFPADITGNIVVEVAGDAVVDKLIFGNRSQKTINLNTALVVLDGGTVTNWVATGDLKTTGFLGDVQIVLTKNFDISKCFDAQGVRTSTDANGDTIFYGISGTSAFQNHTVATLFAKTSLLVDPAIKAAVDASDKINKDSFTEIKEYTYTGTIGSGKLEADAPVVTEPVVTTEAPVETTAAPVETTVAPVETTVAPVETTVAPVETTAAPETPEETPATGDASAVVFAISAACLVAAAAMVFLKKRIAE